MLFHEYRRWTDAQLPKKEGGGESRTLWGGEGHKGEEREGRQRRSGIKGKACSGSMFEEPTCRGKKAKHGKKGGYYGEAGTAAKENRFSSEKKRPVLQKEKMKKNETIAMRLVGGAMSRDSAYERKANRTTPTKRRGKIGDYA